MQRFLNMIVLDAAEARVGTPEPFWQTILGWMMLVVVAVLSWLTF